MPSKKDPPSIRMGPKEVRVSEGLGIFRPTAGNGLSFRFRKWGTAKPPKVDTRQAELRARIDQVAEAFAGGPETLVDVERITGIPRRTVSRLWGIIRQEMGAQAV